MRASRQVLLLLAAALAGWILLSRVRIVFFVRTSFWQLAVLFVVLAAGLFLALNWLFRRRRR